MNTLDKLTDKNHIHNKYVRAERLMGFVLIIGLLPFYVDIIYSAIYSGHEFPQSLLYMLASSFGALYFSLPLMAMVELMIIPKWLNIPAIKQKAKAEEDGL